MTAAPPPMPIEELTRRAFEVLSRELGAGEAARFVGQFSRGLGDYTAERGALFAGLTLDQVVTAVHAADAEPGAAADGRGGPVTITP